MPSISKLLFQVFLTKKVRNESCTENGQVKKGSRLESILPSIAHCCCKKKLDLRADQSMKTIEKVCAMYKAELEKVRKEKLNCTKSKCFTERASTFVGEFR